MQRLTHAHRARTDTPTKEKAPATDRGERNHHFDSRSTADAGKAFATLRAELARRGCCLTRSIGDDCTARFHGGRWGLLRELPDLRAVTAFAEQVGARNG